MKHVKGLKMDWDSGEGAIALPEEFLESYALLRADVLQDWICQLTDEYWAARLEMRLPYISGNEAMEMALEHGSPKAIEMAAIKEIEERSSK